MSKLKLGELCAGYGGLGLAVEETLGAELAWYSEFDAAPSEVMATHWPDVPNHGDMTQIDWANIEPVDIISGGTPCQDLSAAGRRKGMTEGTRSNLWVNMREAIATIKPTYVVWENVRGAYSAKAVSDLEHCPGCMGGSERADEHVLRALGRVLGDLSDLGYDTQWRGLRAADVGAPHGRFRVFVLATRRDAPGHAHNQRGDRRREWPEEDRRGQLANSSNPLADDSGSSRDGAKPDDMGAANRSAAEPGECLGAAAITTGIGRVQGWPQHARVEGGSDATECRASAPTDSEGGRRGIRERDNLGQTRGEVNASWNDSPSASREAGTPPKTIDWGDYAPAIRRWETVRGTAPAPTELTAKGKHRLSARFAEWMMGIPAGWVTDVDISLNDQLKAIGNGVVPQQAIAAIRDMLEANHAA